MQYESPIQLYHCLLQLYCAFLASLSDSGSSYRHVGVVSSGQDTDPPCHAANKVLRAPVVNWFSEGPWEGGSRGVRGGWRGAG